MRIRTFILCLFLCVASAFAKDVITKTDGSKIDAKVEEITETAIKYRKASNPTGPVYTIPLTSVATVLYENGSTDKFNQPSASVAREKNITNNPSDDDLIRMSYNQETANISNDVSDAQLLKMSKKYTSDELLVKRANKYRIIGWVGGGVLLVAGIATAVGKIHYDNVNNNDNSNTTGLIIAAGAVAGTAWCLGFNLKANSLVKQDRQMESYSFSLIENEIMQIGDNSLTAGINLMGNRITHSQSLGLSLGLTF